MFVDGGMLWNMPISLVAAREDVQLKYLGERVDPATIAAFHFTGPLLAQTLKKSMQGV